MSTTYGTTHLVSNSGMEYTYSIKTFINCKGIVRSIEVFGNTPNGTGPMPYMFLDFLAQVFPQSLYTEGTEVYIGGNPVRHPYMNYTEHPCLIVRQNGFGEKRYRLNKVVDYWWALTIPPIHLRAMIEWWRIHRGEFNIAPYEWNIWINED